MDSLEFLRRLLLRERRDAVNESRQLSKTQWTMAGPTVHVQGRGVSGSVVGVEDQLFNWDL